MSCRLSPCCFWSLAVDGHVHLSDSELAQATERNIEIIKREFIVEPEEEKKTFKLIQSTKTIFLFHKNLIFDPKFLWNLRSLNLQPLSQHSLKNSLQKVTQRNDFIMRLKYSLGNPREIDIQAWNYKFHRCSWLFPCFLCNETKLQNNRKGKTIQKQKTVR